MRFGPAGKMCIRDRSIPTLIVFENGAEVRRSVGVVEKEDIYDLLGLPMQK